MTLRAWVTGWLTPKAVRFGQRQKKLEGDGISTGRTRRGLDPWLVTIRFIFSIPNTAAFPKDYPTSEPSAHNDKLDMEFELSQAEARDLIKNLQERLNDCEREKDGA